MGIIKAGDPKIAENTRKRKEWEQTHPGDWKSESSSDTIKKVQKYRSIPGGISEDKKNLVNYLAVSEQL